MKKVLLFGGNGFIGSETCKLMIESGIFDIWVVNRGKSWDWDTPTTIKPFVKAIKFNRDKDITCCKDLVSLSNAETLDAIIDFSGYESDAVQESVDLFRKAAKLYIYISSDSVYEVCEKQHNAPSKETDAQRPKLAERRKQYKRRDSYGHKKLKCEEVLAAQLNEGGIPYVVLRLADVIGAKDSTERWWLYQLWVQAALKLDLPIFVPDELKEKPISVVFVKDVATLILNIISMEHRNSIVNSSFNLACTEITSVPSLLCAIAENIAGHNVRIAYSACQDIPHIYPSVELGPIDCSKAVSCLGFVPTALSDCIAEITNFYLGIVKCDGYSVEKRDMLESMEEDLKELYDKETFDKLMREASAILHTSNKPV